MLLFPSNRFARPDTSPPIPPNAPRTLSPPPPVRLAIPPDAVCFNKLVNSPLEVAALIRELEGEPNWMPAGVSFALNDRLCNSLSGLGVAEFDREEFEEGKSVEFTSSVRDSEL